MLSVSASISTVSEGDVATFIVSSPNGVTADEDIGVVWSVSFATNPAASANDFASGQVLSGIETIAARSMSATIEITTNDDSVFEGFEMFSVTLMGVSPTIGDRIGISTVSTATATILDNDALDIGFEQLIYRVSEDVGSVTLTVSVMSSGIQIGEGVSVTVSVTTMDESATGGEDYTIVRQDLVFTADTITHTVNVNILSDTVLEGSEEFSVTLTDVSPNVGGPAAISAAVNTATVIIEDVDSDVMISLTPTVATISEGTELTFTVSLPDGITAAEDITLSLSVICATDVTGAASPMDVVGGCPSSGTVTISASSTTVDFTIMTNEDNVVENDEELSVSLTGISTAIDVTISGTMSTASVTITDEAVLLVSGPASVDESATGMSVATFTVSLPDGITAADEDITLSWRVNCDTGAVSPEDFANGECPSGSVTITAGVTSAVFSFMTFDDEDIEGTEIFTVSIVTMTAGDFNVTFDDGADEFRARVRLLDDEAVNVSFTAGNLSVTEGSSVTVAVSLDNTISEEVTLPWLVSFVSASASDFASGQALSGTVTIPANMTSAVITLTVALDSIVERDEVFRVIVPLESGSSTIPFGIQSVDVSSEDVTIENADTAEVLLSGPASVIEGRSITFTVSLTEGFTADEDVEVTWSVDCGAGSEVTADDFGGACPSDRVTIPAGSISADFTITTDADMLVEGMETFAVTLTGVLPTIDGHITISDTTGSASAEITDNDRGVVSVTVGTSTVSEGGEVTFTVELADDVIADEAIGVEWSVSCDAGNGITAGDFVGDCPSGTATIAADERMSPPFTIMTFDDSVVEGMEVFTVTLTDVLPKIDGRITISEALSIARVTIVDGDEAELSLTAVSPTVSEGASATFRVTLEGGVTADEDIDVDWSVGCIASRCRCNRIGLHRQQPV